MWARGLARIGRQAKIARKPSELQIEGSNPSGPATKRNGVPPPKELKKRTSKNSFWGSIIGET